MIPSRSVPHSIFRSPKCFPAPARFILSSSQTTFRNMTNSSDTSSLLDHGRNADERKMLDFTCGIGVTNLGHCHPKVSKAAADQWIEIVHVQCSIAFHEPYLRLIKKLLPIMPDPSLDSFFFWNSESKAVEAAIKLARVATGCQNIIRMQDTVFCSADQIGSYHGRTFGAIAVTRSKTVYSAGVAPLMSGAFTIPFPFWHQFGVTPDTPESTLVTQSLYQLDLLLAQQSTPRDTAAIILEAVLGEGGYVPAPDAFLQGLRAVCDKHGILLIINEVQSGFCRTGKFFAIQHSGVRPDITIIAKGLSNGFPLSGVISRKEFTDKLVPGSMVSTYAGNVVSCAAACAVADAMKEENILQNVNDRSIELFKALTAIQKAHPKHILDFATPDGPGAEHDPAAPSAVPKLMSSRVVRFIPPLNISAEDLAKGHSIFREAVEEVIREG
ncbi:acetylornithine aminotransferase [Mycena rebaudengoi]|nr:acetylornithine aminotransferase [Mycena rebaudengoi]